MPPVSLEDDLESPARSRPIQLPSLIAQVARSVLPQEFGHRPM